MTALDNDGILDVAEYLFGASVIVEAISEKPNTERIFLGFLALLALQAKKKGYDFKIVLPKQKKKVKGVN